MDNHHHFSDSKIINDVNLSIEEKKSRITQLFIRAASMGDTVKLNHLLKTYLPEYIDINGVDEDKMSALIHAACFGYEDVVKILIDTEADIDHKDNGWTALLWSCSNGHASVAKLLIEAGANKNVISSSGRSIKELISSSSHGSSLINILDLNSKKIEDKGEDERLTELCSSEFMENQDKDEDENVNESDFDWSKCTLDQMIVFDEFLIDQIVQVAVSQQRPFHASAKKPIPANILFLCTRYANYYASADLLKKLIENAFQAMVKMIQESRLDIAVIAFWITNCTQLLHYMKKDEGLSLSSFEAQCLLTEYISELCGFLYKAIQKKIHKILDDSILDYSALNTQVKFENTLHSLSRQKSLLKTGMQLYEMVQAKAGSSTRSNKSNITFRLSPKSMTTLLSSLLHTLQHYLLHPALIQQIFEQIFYSLGADLFNGILLHRDRCCRSRGVEIRMNISSIEEWVKEHEDIFMITKTNKLLTYYLKPAIHLSQFLQVISSIPDLNSFMETLSSLEGAISLYQARKVIENYKYEVNESSIPEEIHHHLVKITNGHYGSYSSLLSSSHSELIRENFSTVGGGLIGKMILEGQEFFHSTTSVDYGRNNDKFFQLQMDTHHMLPFQMPVLGSKADESWAGTSRVPVIPNDVMQKIDPQWTGSDDQFLTSP